MTDTPKSILDPLPYQQELRDYLKTNESELWTWFSSAEAKADYAENLRIGLLKSTYRLDADGHPALYQAVDQAKAKLNLDIPVTLYQAQHNPDANAALFFIPGEGHLVFSGSVLSLLDSAEITSVISHELSHYYLWIQDQGAFHVADRLVHAVANDPRASRCHEQTARRYQLYTEVFADRGSLYVTGDLNKVVSGLIKVQTGLPQVSGASYLKQAEEIFAKGDTAAEELSHPEAFIRSRALALWSEKAEHADRRVRGMIEGPMSLSSLDLIDQAHLTKATRTLLEHFLQPAWFQTPAVLGHAKQFFSDFKPAAEKQLFSPEALKFADPKLREYWCYVLLDFASADPDLDELPLAAALDLGRTLDLGIELEKLLTKELRVKPRDVKRIKENAPDMLAAADKQRG